MEAAVGSPLFSSARFYRTLRYLKVILFCSECRRRFKEGIDFGPRTMGSRELKLHKTRSTLPGRMNVSNSQFGTSVNFEWYCQREKKAPPSHADHVCDRSLSKLKNCGARLVRLTLLALPFVLRRY